MKQRDFGWMQRMDAPTRVEEAILRTLHSAHLAFLMAWDMRRVKFNKTDLARYLHMPKSHVTGLFKGAKYLPNECRVPFMWFVGNTLIRQWEDLQMEQAVFAREAHKARETAAERIQELRAA